MLAKGSLPLIVVPLVLALISFSISMLAISTPILFILGGVLLLVTGFFIVFFRDPERVIAQGIVAPADGVVTEIEHAQGYVKIVTVMGLADVHVNRSPLEGRVVSIKHSPGQHKLAKITGSYVNERLETTLETPIGRVTVTQIAGAFVRRIVSYTKEGENVFRGQRIGIIKFGSRVDVIMPDRGYNVLVEKGSKVRAGASSLAVEVRNEK